VAERKKQHWVPASYLEEWIDPSRRRDRFVWVSNKDGTECRPSTPENLFHKRDLYTRPTRGSEGRDLSVEEMLGRMETGFPAIREKLRDGLPLSVDDWAALCLFVAAMRARSLSATDSARAMFEDLKRQLDGICAANARQFGPENEAAIAAESRHDPLYCEIESLAEKAAPDWVVGSMEMAKVMVNMRLAVLRPRGSGDSFMTSDAPCVVIDPEHHLLPPFFRAAAPNLGAPKAWLTMPITPLHCLLFSWDLPQGSISLDSGGVAMVNRLTSSHAARWIVANSNAIPKHWLPTGGVRSRADEAGSA
jgi:hypothetical protein